MNAVSYLETGVIYRDDNLARLQEFPDACVDLIYLDPPFFSNRHYEVIWGDEAEVRSFEDRWKGGVREYIGWMRSRAVEMHRLLKPTGSLYLHCDPAASHYLKTMLDDLFGQENFRNEVIWQRAGGKGDARRKFGAVHDTILCYQGSADAFFKPIQRPPDDDYLARFNLTDHDGKGLYHSAPLDSPNPRPNLKYEYKGYLPPEKGWRVSLEQMKQLDADGRLIFPASKEGRIRRKLYLADAPGPPVGDVWTDIPRLQAASQERLGYPTQKPEALLHRIIESSCPDGGTVLDPFCGCGTSIAVAQQMQRPWVGIDISPQAVAIMKQRVDGYGANAKVIGMPATISELKELGPFEFQNWVVETVNGVHRSRKSGDMGIDGYTFLDRLPIQVKRSERVGRNVVDNFETAIARDGKDRGYVVAFSFTRDAYDEAARTREVGTTAVHLVRVSDLLELNDIVLAADAARTEPDLSSFAPDLMGLFAGALARRQHSRRAIPVTKAELFASAERERA